jgi:molybdate transport system substrate-binding protein
MSAAAVRSRRVPSRRVVQAALVAAGLALAGCSSSSSPGASGSSTSGAGSSASPSLSGTVNVFAASSLKESFTTLATTFEAAHPGVHIVFNFGASSGLATDINQGAPADVFASASETNMTQVVTAGGATNPAAFATNIMEIAVPPSNPAGIHDVAGLAKAGVKVALCQAAVPCGVTARKVFAKAHVTVVPVTLEPDVKSVLTKVELNEVDAGVVYVTDVRAAGSKVVGVVIPAAENASTTYPIAALTKSVNPSAANAFVAFVLSPAGAAVLTADGFGPP